MLGEPTLTHRLEGGHDIPLLVWRLSAPARSISSAVLGGGIGECRWVVNASVPMSYDRDDPAAHLGELAAGLGLSGPGVGLLTGVDVADVVAETDEGVRLWATVGLGAPVQAAADEAGQFINDELASGASGNSSRPGGLHDGELRRGVRGKSSSSGRPEPDGELRRGERGKSSSSGRPEPGTVNVVVWVPQRLGDAALVNAVATITEAKAQAIRDLGLAATGTATDAVCVVCPPEGDAAEYGGPRSTWGARVARAAYRAVLKGGAVNLAGTQSWSDRMGQ
ncbi:adenosylcobinamide amidohydrolase [Actinoplanes sp. CA-142083]|uniref:adenosylcobinamide amidohydrolase n=1 Tax=Actinoplanes sp. CA-142083 TaxID=3239903 RepID=UPI003D8C3757